MPTNRVLCFTLLAAALLAGCGGVFQLDIERLPAEAPASLGHVAYIAGGDVWVLDLDTGEQVRVTRDGLNRRPSLSPDGIWAAYIKSDFLYAAKVSGGTEIRVSETGVSFFAWSPEEAALAYPGGEGLILWDGDSQARQEIPLESGPVARLAWHPAGDRLALGILEGSRPEILVVSRDGGTPTWIYAAEGLMDVPRLAGWSPDGSWLAFWLGSRAFAAEQDGLPLCLVPAVGGGPRCTQDRVLLWPDSLAWSPDGRLGLILGGGRETWVGKSLSVLDPGPFLTAEVVPSHERSPFQPAWSPDGVRLAFSAGPATPLELAYEQQEEALQSRHLWLVDMETGRRRQLTGEARYRDENPRWSLDGSHILFVRLDARSAGLWLMRADGGSLRQVLSELTPLPDPAGEYGRIDWSNWWDWNIP